MKIYTVRAGDTIMKIAQRFFGDRSKYRLIVSVNRLTSPNSIWIGQKLKIPVRVKKTESISSSSNPWSAFASTETPSKIDPRDLQYLSEAQLKAIIRYARPENRAKFIVPLNKTMKRYGITSKLRKAHFLAQIAHESGSLKYTEEIASGWAYEGRKSLGNTRRGDGIRFKGRGLIQLTGRTNYTKYKRHSGLNVVKYPHLIANDPKIAVDVSGWFWMYRRLNRFADRDNLRSLTFYVNGGYNGLATRTLHLQRAKEVFGLL